MYVHNIGTKVTRIHWSSSERFKTCIASLHPSTPKRLPSQKPNCYTSGMVG